MSARLAALSSCCSTCYGSALHPLLAAARCMSICACCSEEPSGNACLLAPWQHARQTRRLANSTPETSSNAGLIAARVRMAVLPPSASTNVSAARKPIIVRNAPCLDRAMDRALCATAAAVRIERSQKLALARAAARKSGVDLRSLERGEGQA